MAMRNIAGVLKDLGDYESAKKCYQKVLVVYRKHFGEDEI
jgi:hypothetical protein